MHSEVQKASPSTLRALCKYSRSDGLDAQKVSNYERFDCSRFNIRYWSWNYRGCWHQTCPPVAFRTWFELYPS